MCGGRFLRDWRTKFVRNTTTKVIGYFYHYRHEHINQHRKLCHTHWWLDPVNFVMLFGYLRYLSLLFSSPWLELEGDRSKRLLLLEGNLRSCGRPSAAMHSHRGKSPIPNNLSLSLGAGVTLMLHKPPCFKKPGNGDESLSRDWIACNVYQCSSRSSGVF